MAAVHAAARSERAPPRHALAKRRVLFNSPPTGEGEPWLQYKEPPFPACSETAVCAPEKPVQLFCNAYGLGAVHAAAPEQCYKTRVVGRSGRVDRYHGARAVESKIR